MSDYDDLKVLVESRTPIIVIESREERAIIKAFHKLVGSVHKALYSWSITSGLKRLDIDLEPQKFNDDPYVVLDHIKSTSHPGIYILPDFHPYLSNPKVTRMLKEVAQMGEHVSHHTIVLISHKIALPDEIAHFARHIEWSMPDDDEILDIVNAIAMDWRRKNGKRVNSSQKLIDNLVKNLKGLSRHHVRKLAHNAIFDDGAIDESDLPGVMKAKYELLDQDSVLHFEYDTAQFSDLGGQEKLKHWLKLRRDVFLGDREVPGLDAPKGMMLLGVQGCGKSLAAKTVAGIFGVPLLRLDFGSMYNKYHGETEKNLRGALKTAGLMQPCVLWMDEIEKGLSTSESDEGTSKRILGTLLTWMAERKEKVFLVATSNDIESLPPELVRKGRLDEIFFVDLPDPVVREKIFSIHLARRSLDPATFDIPALVAATEGFSGAEIEQAVVSGLYAALSEDLTLNQDLLMQEIGNTYPLSVTMTEKVAWLRQWAQGRAVKVD